jgi:VWFA-related protein
MSREDRIKLYNVKKPEMLRTANILSIILVLLVGLKPLACPQNERRDSDQPIKLSTELVMLDVQVLNKKTGRAVGGLTKEDFTIYEDGVKQQITHFGQDKLPLSIVLLLDVSGSVRPIIKQIRDGALQAMRHLKVEDEVALMVFATGIRLVQDFTRDRQIIIEKIESIDEPFGVGKLTYINEAIYKAATYLATASSPTSRRVIIAVTDNLSTQQFFIGHSDREVLERLLESGSVVCGLLISRFNEKELRRLRYSPGTFLGRFFVRGNINEYADKTGGMVLHAGKEDVETKLATLIDQLRTRYTLAYTPSNQKLDGKFRKIKVEISPEVEKREGKLAILAKRGYYAQRGENDAK